MASDGQPGIGKKLSAISVDRVPFFTDLVKTISGKERNPVLEDISEPEVQINIIHLKADTFKITGKNRIQPPGKICINTQMFICPPFSSGIQSPLKFTQVARKIVSCFRDIRFGTGRISFTDISVIGYSGKISVSQNRNIRAEFQIPTG